MIKVNIQKKRTFKKQQEINISEFTQKIAEKLKNIVEKYWVNKQYHQRKKQIQFEKSENRNIYLISLLSWLLKG